MLHTIYAPKRKVKVTVRGQIMSAITQKRTKANCIKLHTKIRHQEKVGHAQDTGSHTGQSYAS